MKMSGTAAELSDALDRAHESLRWLGRLRARVDTVGPAISAIDWSVAIACAELHASGTDVIEAGVVRDLLGWDGPSGLSAAERGLVLLGRLELIRAGRLVL